MKRGSPGLAAPLLLAALAAGCSTNPLLVDLFGPPDVQGEEAYDDEGAAFDHDRFDALLSRVVTDRGLVDYEALRADPSALDAYLEELAGADFDALSRDHKLALLINAYNAFTLQLILDHWPVDSIEDIPEEERWDAARWSIGERTLSLTAIEHEYLRGRFAEPRIHFAINCASLGCPPLRREAYAGERIGAQLTEVTERVHADGTRWFDFRPEEDEVALTRIYLWYDGDFERAAGSPRAFAARYHAPLREALDEDDPPEVTWLPYDWALNRAGALDDPGS